MEYRNNMNRAGVAVFIFVICMGIAPVCLSAEETDWGGISLQGVNTVATSSIIYQPNNIVSLWVRIVPEEDSQALQRIRKMLQSRRRDSQNYEYSSFLCEIDCVSKEYREVSAIHYNRNRNIILAVNRTNATWSPMTRENGFHMLHLTFCSESGKLTYGKISPHP